MKTAPTIRRLLATLVRPAPRVVGVNERQTATLLLALLVFHWGFIAFWVLLHAYRTLTVPGYALAPLVCCAADLLALTVSYLIARTTRYRVAAWMLVATSFVVVFAAARFTAPTVAMCCLYYAVVPVLFTVLLLGTRMAAGVFVLTLAALFEVDAYRGDLDHAYFVSGVGIFVFLSGVMMLCMWLKARVDRHYLDALRESDQRQAAMLASFPDAMLRLASDGRIQHTSPGRDGLLPAASAAMLGRLVREVLPEADICEAVAEALRTDVTQSREWTQRTDAGNRIIEGRITRSGADEAIVVLRDVTEARLAQQKLLHASKMASLGEMSAGVAHEIYNPLLVLYSCAYRCGRLAESETPIDRKELGDLARKINDMSARIEKIVKGLRLFSREGSGDPLVETRVADIVASTREICQQRFVFHRISLVVDPIEAELTVRCRPVQISQVLLNLLNNSFDAVAEAEQERREVRIAARDAGAAVEIDVRDTGPGVSPAIRDKLFQPFFTTKAAGKGTGLGLSLSLGIAKQHGGELFLHEASDEGATFVLRLPKA